MFKRYLGISILFASLFLFSVLIDPQYIRPIHADQIKETVNKVSLEDKPTAYLSYLHPESGYVSEVILIRRCDIESRIFTLFVEGDEYVPSAAEDLFSTSGVDYRHLCLPRDVVIFVSKDKSLVDDTQEKWLTYFSK